MILADRRGDICHWEIPERGQDSGHFVARKRAHRGALGVIAASAEGQLFPTRDQSGITLWTADKRIRRVASFELEAAGPLLIDSRHKWLFAAEADGTEGVYAYSRREARRIAGLIYTNQGS